jgi:DNA replication protein DnaC
MLYTRTTPPIFRGSENLRAVFLLDLNPQTVAALQTLDEASKAGKGVLFYGNAGTGKTTILYDFIQKIRAEPFVSRRNDEFKFMDNPGMYVQAPDYIQGLETEYAAQKSPLYNAQHHPQYIARHVKHLVLDDVGAESEYGWRAGKLAELLIARYQDPELRTYIGTNYNPDQLAARYGERITSRLAEMMDWLPFFGEDRRTGKIAIVNPTKLRLVSE